jgi:hypothetical protein
MFAEVPFPARLIDLENVRPRDVRGHEVGCELNPLETEVEHLAERGNEQRLGEAGHAFEESMTAAENGDQHLFDDIGLTNNDLSHLLFHPLIDSVELVYDFPVIFLTRGLKGHKAFTHAMTGSSSAVPSTTRPCFLPLE